MKVTREIIDNGRKIVHVKYEKKELEAMKKRCAEEANHKTELEKHEQSTEEQPVEE